MLKIYIITPFPDILNALFNQSMLKKAIDRGKVKYIIINLFDFVKNNDGRIDDYPYGTGKGMIMKVGPILRAFESINQKQSRVIFPTPDGKLFNQDIAIDLSGFTLNNRFEIFEGRLPMEGPALNLLLKRGKEIREAFSLLYRKLLHQLLLCQFLVFQLLCLFLIQLYF